jgi:hypothetical protein
MANFSERGLSEDAERGKGEVRRSPLPRTPANRGFFLARIVDEQLMLKAS